MIRNWRTVFLAGVFALGATVPLTATEDITVRLRMSKRMERIEALQLRGEIGENFEGYLEEVQSVDENVVRLIYEENTDRKTIYAIIGIKTDSNKGVVGRHRARQIAERSVRGVWIQDALGEWRRKH